MHHDNVGVDAVTDFYEDDEPVDEIIAAFDRGEKGLTSPPGVRITDAPDLMHTATNGTSGTGGRLRTKPTTAHISVHQVSAVH